MDALVTAPPVSHFMNEAMPSRHHAIMPDQFLPALGPSSASAPSCSVPFTGVVNHNSCFIFLQYPPPPPPQLHISLNMPMMLSQTHDHNTVPSQLQL